MARDSFFAKQEPHSWANRVVLLDGLLIDSLESFFCAVGEAVNGPGGYFGARCRSYHDCLFGGFGVEYPYTIIWVNSAHSRAHLGPEVLLRHLAWEHGFHRRSDSESGWCREQWDKAERGWSMFDDLVELTRTASENGPMELVLL